MTPQEGRPAQCEDVRCVLDEAFRCELEPGHVGRHAAVVGATQIVWWPHALAIWAQPEGEAA